MTDLIMGMPTYGPPGAISEEDLEQLASDLGVPPLAEGAVSAFSFACSSSGRQYDLAALMQAHVALMLKVRI